MRLRCIVCQSTSAITTTLYRCPCGGLLEVEHDLAALRGQISRETFDRRLAVRTGPEGSGVWRFRELVFPLAITPVSGPEGNTNLYRSPRLAAWAGLDDLWLKHEGENPTGSFKDRGMTVGVTHACAIGATSVVCASTGNTASSLAAYAARAGLRSFVLVPEGEIAFGKLAQTLAYGARTVQIRGDFDAAMRLIRQIGDRVYILNSINPFRLEGQKTIVFELLQQLNWTPPDWIVLPGGNLGNTGAFGKALRELETLGLISRKPRLAVVQASGANPFYRAFRTGFRTFEPRPARTVATAIQIGAPVNYLKAKQAVLETDGVVTEVSDQEIMDAKAQIDAAGIGCEPASAASLAGIRRLVAEGVIRRGDQVVAILTGHLLKDPGATIDYHLRRLPGVESNAANEPLVLAPEPAALERLLCE